MASETERTSMRRAIALSQAALGSTNPNPCVGAAIINPAGNVIGEGVTQPVGGDHAEIGALHAAGDAARGSTLVVSLEPCGHTGRTPPCTTAILASGISRVVYAMADPHGLAAGGAAVLTAAGVDVEAGLLAEEARSVLGRWSAAMATQRPHVTWKYAATLDGRVAAADGTSQWITGAEARRDVHRERYLADAVIVGIGTVLADDPQLSVRDWPALRQPTRVVVDTDARTPVASRVLDSTASTVIVVADDADPGRRTALEAAGATIVAVPRSGGRLDLRAVLGALFAREIVIVFVEGGPTLTAGLVAAGLVDRVVGYYAPSVFGAGRPLLGDVGVTTLAQAPRLSIDGVATVGTDIRIDARFAERSA